MQNEPRILNEQLMIWRQCLLKGGHRITSDVTKRPREQGNELNLIYDLSIKHCTYEYLSICLSGNKRWGPNYYVKTEVRELHRELSIIQLISPSSTSSKTLQQSIVLKFSIEVTKDFKYSRNFIDPTWTNGVTTMCNSR